MRAAPRVSGPFLGINCGALPPTLIESELFGFERGSFTGASRSHAGMVERASGGTLFLDEVTEMSADMQTRLLRFLETQRFFRVGGSQEMQDRRARGRRDQSLAGAGGARRRDARGSAVSAGGVSDLRWRRCASAAMMWCCSPIIFSPNSTAATAPPRASAAAARQTLRDYHWPGNVRELKNAIERAFILCERRTRAAADEHSCAAASVRCARSDSDGGIQVPIGSSLAQAERWLIEATLAHWAGNKNRAARTLGCSLKTLYNKLAVYERQGMGAEA